MRRRKSTRPPSTSLKVRLHTLKSENAEAVATALTCLRRLGIDMPAHPTQEQVQAEYEAVWQILDGRSIESLIDLPLMTDPELLAAMQVLSALLCARLLYRLPFVVLARVPHGESQPAAWDERRVRVGYALGISVCCWGGLSPLR